MYREGSPQVLSYLDVSHCEYDRIWQVDFIAVFVDSSRYDGRVDDDGVVGAESLAAELHAGVFGGQVRSQVLIKHKRHADLTLYERKRERKRGYSS